MSYRYSYRYKEKIRNILSQRERWVIADQRLTPAAVLLAIYEKDGEPHIVFTKRTDKVEYHKGEVSFPGGAWDEGDESLFATAIRESFEEIGIQAEDVELLGELDQEETVSSKFVVSTFVAALPYPYQFHINRDEVGELIEVPLSALLDQDNFKQEFVVYEGKTLVVYYYRHQNNIIWGATARILKKFLDLAFDSGQI